MRMQYSVLTTVVLLSIASLEVCGQDRSAPSTAPAKSPAVTSQAAAIGGNGDWPNWLGPNYDGISTEKNLSVAWPPEGPKQLWKLNVGAGYSAPAISAGRLYITGNEKDTDTIFCLDAATGKKLWKKSYPCKSKTDYAGTHSTVAIDGDCAYATSREGMIFCLDAATGNEKWTKNAIKDFGAVEPMWGIVGTARIVKDMVVFDFGTVVALNKTTGQLVWKSAEHPITYSTPQYFVMGGKDYLATFCGQGLVVVNLADGKEAFAFPWKTQYDLNIATPIFWDGKVFISSGYGAGCALVDISEGEAKEVWKNKNLCQHCNNAILYDGYLYGVSGQHGSDGELRCVDFKTGDLKWSMKGFRPGALLLADGKLIVIDAKGTLTFAQARPDGYVELAKAKVATGTCWTMPVLSHGRLYIRTHEGELICLDVKGQ